MRLTASFVALCLAACFGYSNGGAFDMIKNAIEDPINTAKETVTNPGNTFKGIMNKNDETKKNDQKDTSGDKKNEENGILNMITRPLDTVKDLSNSVIGGKSSNKDPPQSKPSGMGRFRKFMDSIFKVMSNMDVSELFKNGQKLTKGAGDYARYFMTMNPTG